MSSSASFSTSNAVPVPSCDSWGHFNIPTAGANAVLLDGSGISSTTRISTGLHGVSFSNPERYGGGAYVTIATTEMAVDAGYGVINVPVINGHTGAGRSGGTRFTTYTFPEGFHLNGGTAALSDSSGSYRLNLVSFALATEKDLRSPAVANYQSWSEDFTAWTAPVASGTLQRVSTGSNAVNPFGRKDGVFSFAGSSSVSNYVSKGYGSSGITYTFSLHAKSIGGATLQLLCGGGGNNFGYNFNLLTGAVVSVSGGGQVASNGKITRLGNEWNRLSMTFNATSTTSTPTPLFKNDFDNNDFLVFGAQQEEGSVVTPYIKTEGTVPVYGNQDARKSLVPGASGFGVTGATYTSAITNLLSKRTATAYGTIVIPPNKSNSGSSTVSAYIENGFNVKGVSAGANSLFDVSFVKPMNNTNYCTILCGEYETDQENLSFGTNEATLLHIRAGTGNKYKTVNGFRVEALKQSATDNSWTQQAVAFQSGLTERIHFMVFGGATYGQP